MSPYRFCDHVSCDWRAADNGKRRDEEENE